MSRDSIEKDRIEAIRIDASPERKTIGVHLDRPLLAMLGLGIASLLAAAALALVMASSESLSLLPADDGELRLELVRGDIFPYYEDVQLESASSPDSHSFVISIQDAERYSGFVIERNIVASSNSFIRLRWRATGDAQYVQVELNGVVEDVPENLTWSTVKALPGSNWSDLEIPLQHFGWNEFVNPMIEPREISHSSITSFALTVPPGSDFQLELSNLELTTPSRKWILVAGLGLLGAVLIIGSGAFLLTRGRRRAEAARDKSEASYTAIFESVEEGILLIDPASGRVTEINRTARELFELPPEVVLDRDSACLDWLDPDALFWTDRFEWEGVTCQGNPLQVEIHTHQARIAGKSQWLAVLRDIRARKQADAERRQLQADLLHTQKMQAIGSLAGGVAHDFNNLLTGIICTAESILESQSQNESCRGQIEQILELSDRAAKLTHQLLAFSRKEPVLSTRLSAKELFSDMLHLLERVIGSHIRLKFYSTAERDFVAGDPGQLEQMLLNLVINARDAMPEGGSLTIWLDNSNLTEDAPLLAPGTYLRLHVRDTGEGIPADIQNRIFEPFFTTKDVGKGTGLGLATVYNIVTQHQGCVEFSSRPGEGTTFTILLPTVEAPPLEEPAAAKVPDAGGTETILVLEDNAAVLNLVTAALTSRGYRAIAAGSTADAERILSEEAQGIDLLLSDVSMPGENGPHFYRRMTRLFPNLQALFMSGFTDLPAVQNGALPEGRLLKKPFRPEELCLRIREALDADLSRSVDKADGPSPAIGSH